MEAAAAASKAISVPFSKFQMWQQKPVSQCLEQKCCLQLCTCCLVNVLPVCNDKGQTRLIFTGVQPVCQSLCYGPHMNETTGTYTVTFSGSNFSHAHAMLLGDVVQTQCCLWRSCPALKHFSDALYDWADGYGAELLTTEVSQLNCSHNAQRSWCICWSVHQSFNVACACM